MRQMPNPVCAPRVAGDCLFMQRVVVPPQAAVTFLRTQSASTLQARKPSAPGAGAAATILSADEGTTCRFPT